MLMKEEAAALAAELAAEQEGEPGGGVESGGEGAGDQPANWDLWSAKGSRMGCTVIAAPVVDRMGPRGPGKTFYDFLKEEEGLKGTTAGPLVAK
jgi:hypothetical protein